MSANRKNVNKWRRKLSRQGCPSFRPVLLHLNPRILPSIGVLGGFPGLNFGDSGGVPPNPEVAAGPKFLVEVVNDRIAFFNKEGAPLGDQSLDHFFKGYSPPKAEPVVVYDELVDRFVVAVGDETALEFAVSDTADPTGGWSEMQKLNFLPVRPGFQTEAGPPSSTGGDLRIGWNADAYVFTLDDPHFRGICCSEGQEPPSFRAVVVDKISVLDRDPDTLTYYNVEPTGFDNYRVVGAADMHSSVSGDPLWLVLRPYDNNGSLTFVRMYGVLGGNPVFEEMGSVFYSPPPAELHVAAPELLHIAWRAEHLVFAHTTGIGDHAGVEWFELETSGGSLSFLQTGTIDPGPGADAYLPALELATDGNFGMSFVQKSPGGYASVFATGRTPTDPLGFMEEPAMVRAGEGPYTDPAGRYSGVALDAENGITFWAVNEYATKNNWGTWVAHFAINNGEGAIALAGEPSRAWEGITFSANVDQESSTTHDETEFPIAQGETFPDRGAVARFGEGDSPVTCHRMSSMAGRMQNMWAWEFDADEPKGDQ